MATGQPKARLRISELETPRRIPETPPQVEGQATQSGEEDRARLGHDIGINRLDIARTLKGRYDQAAVGRAADGPGAITSHIEIPKARTDIGCQVVT